ncbi:SMC family ATPase [Sporosarcina sp. ANT_H38]|uniref:AAA family ATPase n=1 Tax=Sporosarcina sp. ANT_H38 TaxID=2597358 RepID=UPI0011F19BED|nr:SMC family ATPase [Sporosarcina sp. ANT_H38]KAA0948704.1 SMC family ATPase [Sporosarcina sp. ANT_H38]
MKIEMLLIRNFRIFNGVYEFDFSNKDLIIISGPNGNGKSTIFDSIQWCLTGSIPRYEGSNERQKFNYLMNESLYRDNRAHTMSVEIWFRSETDKVHKVKRIQKKSKDGRMSPSQVMVDGDNLNKTTGTESIRNLFSNTSHEERKSAINLSTFFAATQLLSQDALQNFIRSDKPSERYKLIDNILGVRKYGIDFENFIEETKEVAKKKQENLIAELKQPQAEYERVSIQINEKEKLMLDLGLMSEKEAISIINELIESISNNDDIKDFNILAVKKIENGIIKELVAIQSFVTAKKESLEQLVLAIQNGEEAISLQPQNYTQQRHEAVRRYKWLKDKTFRRNKGKEIVTQRKILMESLKIRRSSYQETKTNYEEARRQSMKKAEDIANLLAHKEIKKIINNYSNTNAFLTKYDENKSEFYLIQESEKYHELDNKIKTLRGLIAGLDAAINKENEELLRNNAELDRINSEIEGVKNKVSESKESLVSKLVRQVQDHLLQEKDNSVCLVCGTEYIKSEFLQQKVLEQIESINKSLTEFEKILLDLTAEKSVFSEKIRKVKTVIKSMGNNINDYNAQIDEMILGREVLINNTLGLYDFILNNSSPLSGKEEKFKFLTEYKLGRELIHSLGEMKEEIKELQDKGDLFKKNIDLLKLESGNWKHYLDLNEIFIQKKLQTVNNYFLRVAEEEIGLQQEVLSINQQVVYLDNKWAKREKQIKEIQNKLPDYTGNIYETHKWTELLNERVVLLNNLEEKIKNKLPKVRNFLQVDEVTKLSGDRQLLKESIDERTKTSESYHKFINEELELLKKKHTEVRSDLISDYLLRHSEFIDQLFMQISPHAIYRHVQLVPKEKNLYIVLTKESAKDRNFRNLEENELKQQFNASLKFSSAQSNVLAVCIFLALNRSQKWTNLNFLGIDDPFQNLDDINVFSFLDVLSQVVLMQNKQLLISTHNENFVQLLSVKMGLDARKVGTIVFSAYNEDGVNVKGNCIKDNVVTLF